MFISFLWHPDSLLAFNYHTAGLMFGENILATKTLQAMQAEILRVLILGLKIKILNQNIMFLLILCYQQQVQNNLIKVFGYVIGSFIKLFVFLAENVDLDSILPLKFAVH